MAPTKKRLDEPAIFNAVEYALRHEGVTEIAFSEDGEYEVEIHEASSLMPFVRCLLRELEVIT
ncbi:hypothetical protein L614_002000000210 [Ochrobactrum sp. J50]|uniref:hypothetical protein n=1 Tax=Brucella/Ochrobactrum group TaxID=2826938 RepID=UPI00119DC34F|nr:MULTISPECIES: hypothetical protein [Brucella/Ochrobactrum group]MCO7729044.1 hypothetical protein [Brucella intermedia]TWH01787.1 hypothetical protein L614_002000000210 [Ochrobactrum sp. J50]